MNIKNIQIYGERNSGTNYLHFLLEENIRNVKVGYKFGWKHGFAKIDLIKQHITPKGLIICIFKDPYSWLVSMHRKPHHAPQMRDLTFSNFLQEEWACYEGKNFDSRDLKKEPLLAEQEMLYERNPITNQRFENVIKMRTGKAQRLLELQHYCPNVLYVRYEDLLDKPRVNVCDIAEQYKMRLKGPVKVSMGYFGMDPKKIFDRKEYYAQKKYLEKYSPEDLAYVNSQLDFGIESQLGYTKVNTLTV